MSEICGFCKGFQAFKELFLLFLCWLGVSILPFCAPTTTYFSLGYSQSRIRSRVGPNLCYCTANPPCTKVPPDSYPSSYYCCQKPELLWRTRRRGDMPSWGHPRSRTQVSHQYLIPRRVSRLDFGTKTTFSSVIISIVIDDRTL